MSEKFEVPAEMREFAEKSVDQARKAVDGFLTAAQKAVDTVEGYAPMNAGAKDMSRKTFAFAEQNIAAAFELAQKLVRAKDPMEAMKLQAEYVQAQLNAMQSQMREFGGLVQTAATQATKTAADTMTPESMKRSK